MWAVSIWLSVAILLVQFIFFMFFDCVLIAYEYIIYITTSPYLFKGSSVKWIVRNRIKVLYLYSMIIQKQMVLQGASYKIKYRKGKSRQSLSITMSFRFFKQLVLILIGVCKLFSCDSKLTHALLALKRGLIDLQ